MCLYLGYHGSALFDLFASNEISHLIKHSSFYKFAICLQNVLGQIFFVSSQSLVKIIIPPPSLIVPCAAFRALKNK